MSSTTYEADTRAAPDEPLTSYYALATQNVSCLDVRSRIRTGGDSVPESTGSPLIGSTRKNHSKCKWLPRKPPAATPFRNCPSGVREKGGQGGLTGTRCPLIQT